MSVFKRKIEIFLTIAIVVMAFQYLHKNMDQDTREPISTVQLSTDMDVYERADATLNTQTLETMARGEAQKMVMTGDVKIYEAQLRQNGLIF